MREEKLKKLRELGLIEEDISEIIKKDVRRVQQENEAERENIKNMIRISGIKTIYI